MSTPSLATPKDPSPQTIDLTRDEVFGTLSNPRRRYALHILRERDEPTSISYLAEEIAARENETTPEKVTYKQRKRVYTSLHQTHLPALSDSGLVQSERAWEDITLTERAAVLDTYLDEPKATPQWSSYYLAVAGLALAVVAVAWAGLYPFSLLPGLVYAAFTSALLLVTALAQTYVMRG